MSLSRQFAAYLSVGAVATALHYALLIALVEAAGWRAVPAALAGYVAGGILSYVLNRRHTFASERPHAEATWRFAAIAFAGFCLTYLFMRAFVEGLGAPYFPSQMVTTGIIVFLTFAANRLWTFRT